MSKDQKRWGKITPMKEHPNLFYNLNEIVELREMTLDRNSPKFVKHLYDLYHSEQRMMTPSKLKDKTAVSMNPEDEGFEQGYGTYYNNMYAALNYALEPTEAKADAIRTALLGIMIYFPAGLGDWH